MILLDTDVAVGELVSELVRIGQNWCQFTELGQNWWDRIGVRTELVQNWCRIGVSSYLPCVGSSKRHRSQWKTELTPIFPPIFRFFPGVPFPDSSKGRL
jgi:hypothetical protein